MVTKHVPTNADEFAEALFDLGVPKNVAHSDEFPELIKRYAEFQIKNDPGIQQQIDEQKRKNAEEIFERWPEHRMADDSKEKLLYNERQRDVAGAMLPKQRDVGHVYNKNAVGAQLTGDFESFGDMLALLLPSYVRAHGHDAKLQAVTRILGEAEGDSGGFLVPEEFRAELFMNVLEQVVVRPRARVLPMSRPTMRMPAIRDTTHASTVFGGVQGTWVPEGGTVSSNTNEPTFSQIVLTANKLTGYTRVGNELIADSAIALEPLLMSLFGEALAYFEDNAFINGTGVGQPTGILNADALVAVAKETGQAANTIVWENIVKMFSRLLPQSMGRAVWLCNQDTIPQLATMALSVGTGGSAIWVQNGQAGLPQTLLGRPIIYSEKCQTLGTAGDIYLVDFSQYLIGDRQAVSVMASPHVNFTTDETVWRFTHRVDGRLWMDSAITQRNGTNTLTPIVDLATRA